jgi:1,4-alpha-glucan branching enzyme
MAHTAFMSLFTEFDINLFKAGKYYRAYEKLGSHTVEHEGTKGTYFAVWAPNAKQVSVFGDFNHWNKDAHLLNIRLDGSGIWEGFVPEVGHGAVYKYHIISNNNNLHLEKADPFARHAELSPGTASIVWDMEDYEWNDNEWIHYRYEDRNEPKPQSVYEVHLGSWRRKSMDGKDDWYSYRELADVLVPYVKEMGFTHVELMPVTEHPFYGSWGYQTTGYFAPTSRYGTPQDFMHLVNAFHEAGIGVLSDWVPSHFPGDAHGLHLFDGTHLYEHADPRKGFHPDWKSYIYNFGRNEIRSFLISNALFWLDKYHIDGLRVDAVASMLYLDYSRNDGEWIPNKYGGKENLESIAFLKELNEAIHSEYKGVITIAEESTSWPKVSRPTFLGGLGFDQKWMMGWMNDTLAYFERDTQYRKFHQGELTFSLVYAFSENFMLPFSHDEVVHGKGSMIRKMPGDLWQKAANLRLMYGMMFTHPGTQLLFMGAEIGQWKEWNHDQGLDWGILENPQHKGIQTWVKDLNKYVTTKPAMFEKNFSDDGFEWVATDDTENCVLIFVRKGNDDKKNQIVVCHNQPDVVNEYRFGVPQAGTYREVLNSDKSEYGGSGIYNGGDLKTEVIASHGQEQSITVTLPPLGIACFELIEE